MTTASPSDSRHRIVGTLAARFAGLILLASGALKLGSPWIETSHTAVVPVGVTLGAGATELFLACATVVHPASWRVLRWTLAFVIAATLLLAAMTLSGVQPSQCGCFGPYTAALGSWHFLISAALLAATSLAAMLAEE